jgi:predicted outer membrane repeat protein
MSKIALTPNNAGTGTFSIAAPGTNTDRTLTLPDATGTILSSAAIASQAQAEAGTDNTTVMTPLRTAQAIAVDASPILTFSSNTATTSGSAFDFTGIPSTAREIEVYWQNVRLSDGSDPAIQLIIGGTPVTSGYQSSSSSSGTDSTTTEGFHLYNDLTARYFSGIMRVVNAASGVWVQTHSTTVGGAETSGGGWISGLGTLTGIRVTRVNGAGTFIQGNVSISYR